MVKGLRCSMAILSVAIVFIAYLAFAQSYKTLQPSVQITTCSETLKIFRVTKYVVSVSVYYYHTDKVDLTQLNFGLAPPGGKLTYTLILANFENVTINNITYASTLNQTTEYIIDLVEVYGFGKLYSESSAEYVFNFGTYVQKREWPVTLGPNEAVLIKYTIEIATTCPVDVTYSWSVSFNSV